MDRTSHMIAFAYLETEYAIPSGYRNRDYYSRIQYYVHLVHVRYTFMAVSRDLFVCGGCSGIVTALATSKHKN